MDEAQEQDQPTYIPSGEAEETMALENGNGEIKPVVCRPRRIYTWWLQTALYSFAILAGQTAAVLLGRLYFENGGKSNWMASLVQTVGFPLFLPFLFISLSKTSQTAETISTKRPSLLLVGKIYTLLGVFLGGICLLYSFGLQNLSVSTYTLVSGSQLAFTAFFAFFLNSQKLTPYIINSLVLVTTSTVLLAIQNDHSEESSPSSKQNHLVGFACTIAASAGHALLLCLTQLVFQKIIKRETFKVVLEVSICESVVATVAIIIGLFISGDWKTLKVEMEEFKMGKALYVVNLVCTAISWEIFSVGCYGLIFKVSSLFSNVIDIVSLPIAPVLAVIFFHDKMTGIKVISLLLAVWGFISYVYQHYLDDVATKNEKNSPDEVPLAALN